MSVRSGYVFCQRCLASNSVARELCDHCGTRLMLVVEPSTQRFEDGVALGCDYDEHLLERITFLENRMVSFADKLERTLDLLLRQARSSYSDHALLDSLVNLLAETEIIKKQTLLNSWRQQCDEEKPRAVQSENDSLFNRVMQNGCDRAESRKQFESLIRRALGYFSSGAEKKGLRDFEKAATLALANTPLQVLLGEYFFRSGEMAQAREYLNRALNTAPDDVRLRLLLGLACGDEGDWRRAKQLLIESIKQGKPTFAAHYALGRLFVAESAWDLGIAHFKRALNAKDCPEAHYVLGVAYYQLGRHRLALTHLTKAVEGAPDYGEAMYVLGLVRLKLGQRELAQKAFETASSLDKSEPRYKAASRARGRKNAVPPPAFLPKSRTKRGFVTGVDERLAAALAADALEM